MGKQKVTLRHFILLVAALSIFLTLMSSVFSGYLINKDTLKENTLETNRVYADKVANTTDMFMGNSLRFLEYSAKEVAPYVGKDEEKVEKELNRLKYQLGHFNAVSVIDSTGTLLITLPHMDNLEGGKITTPGAEAALEKKEQFISKPYYSMTGRLLIFMTTPIFAENGDYLGYVGGSIFLEEENALSHILKAHAYTDGSSVYVVDEDGKIIYHKDAEMINTSITCNPVYEKLQMKEDGAQQVKSSKYGDVLAGYAYVPSVDWGVIVQRPTDIVVSPARKMVQEMILKSSPFILLSIIIVYFVARRITEPLYSLAYYAEKSTKGNNNTGIDKIKTPYYEAVQLKGALKRSLTFLHGRVDYFKYESTTDPLTKLTNRRTLEENMNEWIENEIPFSLILADIDHFKHVNDKYGHNVGDEVLKFLAKEMVSVVRHGDICCRYGGEEFIILLPYADKRYAFKVAERLKEQLEKTPSPTGETITISSGIATYLEDGVDVLELIDVADKRMYKAKEAGRNKTNYE